MLAVLALSIVMTCGGRIFLIKGSRSHVDGPSRKTWRDWLLMNNLTGPGPPAAPCRDPSIQGHPPQLAGRKGAHHGLSSSYYAVADGAWWMLPAISATMKKRVRACTLAARWLHTDCPLAAHWLHAAIRVGSRPLVHTIVRRCPHTTERDTACMRGCGEGCLVDTGVLGRALSATVSRARWRTGSTRCTRSLHGRITRIRTPSQSERREGLEFERRGG